MAGAVQNPSSRPAARVVYHANCFDGIVAAAVAGNHIRTTARNAGAAFSTTLPSFTPASYNDKFAVEKYTADHVYIVDFSFPIEQMKMICAGSGRVTLIDHHDTASKFLAIRSGDRWEKAPGLPANLDVHFDLTRSGARLAWATLNPNIPEPRLVTFAHDYDLWEKNHRESSWLAAAHGFSPWSGARAMHLLNNHEDMCKEAGVGSHYFEFMTKQAADIARHATPTELPDSDGNMIRGYLLDCPAFMANEVAEVIRNEHAGETGFIALVTQRHVNDSAVLKLSLRRLDNVTDVGKIATHFGGGGHPYAASGNITWSQLGQYLDQQPLPAPAI